MFGSLKQKNDQPSVFKNGLPMRHAFSRAPGTSSSVTKENEADRLVRCRVCGWICDRERDVRLKDGTFAHMGIKYSSQQTAGASIGDALNNSISSVPSIILPFDNDFDDSLDRHSGVVTGSVTIDTSQKSAGSGSALFGSGSYLTYSSYIQSLGTADFRIDFKARFKFDNIYFTIASQYLDANNFWRIYYHPDADVMLLNGQINGVEFSGFSVSCSIVVNQWYLFSFRRVGNVFTAYLNGSAGSSVTDAVDFNFSSALTIGKAVSTSTDMLGWIDDFIITLDFDKTTPDKYYTREVVGGCPACGTFLYDQAPAEIPPLE